ncbi:ABC transporter substrate-binding protein [Alloyangia pacifica]|uniref:Amino acid/amide ABC transporter substrate-binding protein, HAAT family (TC 3.A.1.4.-) n=1 Tax=Alloyangia pacifica TaxID=311180 RepID=A0A1I6WAD0_9RHOB|nr:ABC transporter substrate-binding protein [Alloyangia pacifica]SDI50859.1 amino acid/amide ABC transporter substrate-binding protein, HAAT family [Alloyangia pacifica]SFT22957.1 amino acid/amide ABC transporter substrate-binding protein, HAAT family (TC 3.A.1.4.-) [Alloyangia pacifica]
MPIQPTFTRRALMAGAAALSLLAAAPASAAEPIKLGLVAALSGQSAKSGEAITRGIELALDKINGAGGVLGRPLELVSRDDESNPGKGLVAARELVQREEVAALIGGLDTPVSMAIVPYMNEAKVPFVGPWAAGTPITMNGAEENYVFRVSAVDEYVDEAITEYLVTKYGAAKPGMILINNPWGESNEAGLTKALAKRGMEHAGIEKFESNDVDVVPQLTRLKENGADSLFLVANVAPSAQVVKSLDRMGWDVPIASHWGPAGGRFTELAGASGEKVHFIQTFLFTDAAHPLFAALQEKYPEIETLADVTPATGIANAYDATLLLAAAIEKAGSTEGPAIREAMYQISGVEGVIKTYDMPFTPEDQDALGPEDYVFSQFVEGEIVPLMD